MNTNTNTNTKMTTNEEKKEAMHPYTITNESISVVVDGKPHTHQKGSVVFNQLLAACLNSDAAGVADALKPASAMKRWLVGTDFCVNIDGQIHHGVDDVLPKNMQERMQKMADAGEDPSPVARFYERLQKNPSARSVTQLFDFLKNAGIPIEKDGTILTYKGVQEDLTDCHTGTVDNTPGTINEMQRNKISDDPQEACHYGYHVGALGYAGPFGCRTVICRVDPADVVSVPYDASQKKMRVCKYEVVGHHVVDRSEDTTLPSTVYAVDTEVIADIEEEDEALYDEDDDDEEDYWTKHRAAEVQALNKTAALNKMGARELIKETLADLRTYATKTLKIVGASKLHGGKTALIARITRVRREKG